MRMSCNGCRVLRKGCTEKCEIRPCIEWINSPDSQANATLFLAKFYGRAGLLNLINATSQNLRPAIFRSLLYEACGRIVNPTFGSVGLLWSGSWAQCQAAVDAVLQGSPVIGIDAAASHQNPNPHLRAGDIRHVSRDSNSAANKVKSLKTRNRFKRSLNRPKIQTGSLAEFASGSNSNGTAQFCNIADPDDVCWNPTRNGSGGDQQAGDEDGLELTLGLTRP